MTTTTIRNIPNEVYQKVKERAIANKRSVNSEIVFILENAVDEQNSSSEEKLARIRKFRAKTAGKVKLTESEISAAKRDGRS